MTGNTTTQRTTIFLNSQIVTQAKAQAIVEGITLTKLIEIALIDYLPRETIIKKADFRDNIDQQKNELKDKNELWKKNKSINIKNWRNEHGQPNLEFLQSLAEEESPRSLEKLRAIAEDLNVNYSKHTPIDELIQKIIESVKKNPIVTS